ncbi:hypothetical protein [Catelliglobosispora koreensis]|uniref:hypothetical protein n=1 Tax=Catelliglobosispora koreensis TaxID=129052 RepID=UPI00037221A3|nr:hypothetical protein [Catelliglobosispora koreensis]
MNRAAALLSLAVQTAVGAVLAGPVGAFAGLVLGGVFGLAIAQGRAYPPSAKGVLLLVLDHTWSLPNTIVGSAFLLVQRLRGHTLDLSQTVHSGRIYIRERFVKGYAVTVGNVIAGATPDLCPHEELHVRQARILGPLYFPLVGLGYVIGTVFPYWLFYHDHEKWPVKGPVTYFTCGVYPHVWHEAWAYRSDRRRATRS